MLPEAAENGSVLACVVPSKALVRTPTVEWQAFACICPLCVMLCSAFVESLAEFLPRWYFEVSI